MSGKNSENEDYSLDTLREMTEGDEEFMQSMVEIFKVEAAELTTEFQKAISDGNTGQVNRLAHKVKPTLKQFEMQDLYQQALELESLEEETDAQIVKEKVRKFTNQLQSMADKVSLED